MLLLSDPRVADVPVVDGGEPLLDLRGESRMLVDLRKCAGAGAWARVRDGAALRLLVAQDSLPDGLRLLVVEGHRPAALEQRCFDEHRSKVEQAHPDWSAQQLDAEASKQVAPPSVAPRPCGAAVDLTLWADGEELDLGTAINATPGPATRPASPLRRTSAPRPGRAARSWVLRSATRGSSATRRSGGTGPSAPRAGLRSRLRRARSTGPCDGASRRDPTHRSHRVRAVRP